MYVELHARSAFTFLEGGSIPEELVDVCAKLGMKAMALLDRDGVYGSARFHLAAKKLELKAHIGAEITTSAQSIVNRGQKESAVRSRDSVTVDLPLIVSEHVGYQNLCRLITQMKARGPKNCDAAITAASLKDLHDFA